MKCTRLRETMCQTCPWRQDSPYEALRPHLEMSAISEANRICHSTGANNGINKRTGLPPHICRGAREIQLRVMTALKVIDAPTDQAWNEARVRMGMEPEVIGDPVKKGK
jgi:hypothetical protein